MRTDALLKAGLCSASSIIAFVLMAASVPEGNGAASAPPASFGAKTVNTAVRPTSGWISPAPAASVLSAVAAPLPGAETPAEEMHLVLNDADLHAAPALLPAVDQDDILPRHRLLADAVLRMLPSDCASRLKHFYVRYDKPKQRGLGGQTTIILDGSVPDAEFVALLVHECGHLAHASLTGSPASGKSVFKDGNLQFYTDSPAAAFFSISWERETVLRSADKKQFVSGYAASDAFEDFAETFAAYVLHKDALTAQAKDNALVARKLAWMEGQFPMSGKEGLRSSYVWKGKAPWDMTKQAFTWESAKIEN